MRNRVWKVQWRSHPQPDGLDRLGSAVKLAIDHAGRARSTPTTGSDERRPLVEHESADGREELDA
jgi:hypothetical protein